ncbi:hypothetical protein ACRJ4W_25280 [Streptomyces sp. GLT-R25]
MLWSAGSGPGDEKCHDLSEQEVGNNSAALALRTRRRAEVHGPEHFLDLWQDVSAVSVPVLAPENGQVLGTLTVASGLCTGCTPHPGAALAEATATAVEAELLARSRTTERVLLDAFQRAAAHPGAAVVALDGKNRLLSDAAAGNAVAGRGGGPGADRGDERLGTGRHRPRRGVRLGTEQERFRRLRPRTPRRHGHGACHPRTSRGRGHRCGRRGRAARRRSRSTAHAAAPCRARRALGAVASRDGEGR